MIDLTGFSQGFTQRTDENRRSRQEFAKAFEEFKRNNPYASLQEFQSFIDQSTGGNNYLSAGAPSKKVLQQLADENAKRKLADVTRQQVADLSSRVRTQGELAALVDKSFLNSDINENTDYKDLYSTFAKTFNMVDEKGNPNFGGFNVENLFTRERAERVMQNEAMRLLPSAMQIINNSKGQIESDTLQKSLGISKSIADPLVKLAKESYDRDVKEWAIRNKTAILDRGLAAMRDGRVATDEMEVLFSEMGYDLKKLPDVQKIIKSYAVEAKRIRDIEDEERNRKIEYERYTQMNQIRNDLRRDEAVQALIRSGDEESATRLMLERVKFDVPDSVFQAVFGVKKAAATPDRFRELFKFEAAQAVAGQKDTQGKRQDGAVAAATTASAKVDEQNQQRVEQLFGKDSKVSPLTGKVGGLGVMVAQDIAKQYMMTPQVVDALTKVFAQFEVEKGVPTSYASLLSAVKTNPDFIQATAGQSVAAYKQSVFDKTRQNQGGFNVEKFDSFMERTNNEIRTSFQGFSGDLDKIKRENDPQNRLLMLKNLQSEVGRTFTTGMQELEARRTRADRWVEYGTGGWNESAISGQNSSSLNNILLTNYQEFQAKIQEIAAQAEKEINGGKETQYVGQNRSKSEAATPIGRAWEDATSDIQRSRELDLSLDPYLSAAGIEGYFYKQSAQERADAQALVDFYSDAEDGNMKRILMRDPKLYNEFLKDPIAFMKKHNSSKWYNDWKSRNK